MSASPRLSMASLTDSSGTDRSTSVFTEGVLRQNSSCASSVSSTPGLKPTTLYGPAPMGAFLNPSSPTRSTYFLGTIQAAPVAGLAQHELVRQAVRRRGPRFGQTRRGRVARHGLYQRVMNRVVENERRHQAFGLGGIEPARHNRDVVDQRHLARGRLPAGARQPAGTQHRNDEQDKHTKRSAHVLLCPGTTVRDEATLLEYEAQPS